MTPGELKAADPKCDRDITLFGYLRGCNLKPGARLHLAGVGDFTVFPPPLPSDLPAPIGIFCGVRVCLGVTVASKWFLLYIALAVHCPFPQYFGGAELRG